MNIVFEGIVFGIIFVQTIIRTEKDLVVHKTNSLERAAMECLNLLPHFVALVETKDTMIGTDPYALPLGIPC